LRWGFNTWRDFFNDRQLLSLGLLGRAVRDVDTDPVHREALATLFSGVLEFNNLFCSFKGEGTGAVRHMFSHHVLKPERMPLEAHPWGTPASSGSFSTLFETRLIRAFDYKRSPHDIVLSKEKPERRFGLASSIGRKVVTDWSGTVSRGATAALLRTGSSSATVLPDASADLVITDPPFMDNVHYSELADFFHAWLREVGPFKGYPTRLTTRSLEEVQNTDPQSFGEAITAVWRECARVLKPHGLLAFTFHQSKIEGWTELVKALESAKLVVTSVQPVKAEMSTASPKSGARLPSNLDSIVVCRKAEGVVPEDLSPPDELASLAERRLRALHASGISVGVADCRSVVWGSVCAVWTHPGCDIDLPALVDLALTRSEACVAGLRL
jgi:hypothetical protein